MCVLETAFLSLLLETSHVPIFLIMGIYVLLLTCHSASMDRFKKKMYIYIYVCIDTYINVCTYILKSKLDKHENKIKNRDNNIQKNNKITHTINKHKYDQKKK